MTTTLRRRLVAIAAIAAIAAAGIAASASESLGDVVKTPTCYGVFGEIHVRYDARVGAQIKIMEEGGRKLTALIPHTVNGQPNPHFERLYMLALNRGKFREICMDGDRASSAVVGMTVIYQ
jgi:hypothetical protein